MDLPDDDDDNDLFRRVLSDIAVWIYQGITKMMEDEIHPILVQALLEHEGIGGLSGQYINSAFYTPHQ